MRLRYGHGTVAVQSRFGCGAVEVYGRGTVEVRSRYTVAVWLRLGRGTVAARHVIQCSMFAVRSRYSLRTLPVRSWYGILKVRSHLVFLTRLEPGTRTVRFVVRIAQSRLSWIRKVFAA